MKVFVLLPRMLDAVQWLGRYERGEVPDHSPYGYHHAEKMNCEVLFSRGTATPGGLLGLLDRGFRRFLGCDLRHIWHNRDRIFDSSIEVIWTHTEYEHLAVRLLCRLLGQRCVPMISQSVWLVDDWPRLGRLRQKFYRYLLSTSEVLSFLSPENAAQARRLGLAKRIETLLFGISLDSFPLKVPRERRVDGKVKVLALGNDKHRDWETFAEAFAGQADVEARIGSSKFPAALKAQNFDVASLSAQQVRAAYEWADCVVVPLGPNLHASGCTAVLEAVALGVPVVATDIGGISAYFGSGEIILVEAGRADALRDAVIEISRDPTAARLRCERAQARLLQEDLSTVGYAARNVALSLDLCQPIALSRFGDLEGRGSE